MKQEQRKFTLGKSIWVALAAFIIFPLAVGHCEDVIDGDAGLEVQRVMVSEGGRIKAFTMTLDSTTARNPFDVVYTTTNPVNKRSHRVTTLAHTENFCVYGATTAGWNFTTTHFAVVAPSATFTTIKSHDDLWLLKQPGSSTSTLRGWIEEAAE